MDRMITIKINNKRFKGVYRWEDITLQRFCDLAAIPMPDGYEKYILADGKFSTETIDEYVNALSEITEEQINITFPAYYRKVIACLTNIPNSVIIPTDKINDLYEVYFRPFIVSLLYHKPVIYFMGEIVDFRPEPIKHFRIGLSKYYLPETVNVLGQEVPLMKESIMSYTEASDIFRGMKVSKEDVKRLALFMAIYCRKKGEEYDERKALERNDLMMNVPMSIVWSVFFYTLQFAPDYLMIIQLFGRLPKQIREAKERARDYQSMVVVD
jgi:hypothetical protein